MKHLEVRCCCQPTKLLGWLPAPSGGAHERMFPLMEASAPGMRVGPTKAFLEVRLTVAKVILETDGEPQLAYRSDDTPIETLRLIPGFVEVGPGAA